MLIEIEILEVKDARGESSDVSVKSHIVFSPNEGYDAEKLAVLERELGPYIEDRLIDALRKHEKVGGDGAR